MKKLDNLKIIGIATKPQKTIYDNFKSKALKLHDLKLGNIIYGHYLPFEIVGLCFLKNKYGKEFSYWLKIKIIDDKPNAILNGDIDYTSLSDHNIVDGGYNPSLFFTDKNIASQYKVIYNNAIKECHRGIDYKDHVKCGKAVRDTKWFSTKPLNISNKKMCSLGFKEVFDLIK